MAVWPRADGAHLESLVLQHTLDRCILAAWRELRVEDDSKGAVSYDFALSVRQVSGFASETILDLFADYFCFEEVSGRHATAHPARQSSLPPILKLEKAVGRFCDITLRVQGVGDPAAGCCYREYGGLALST